MLNDEICRLREELNNSILSGQDYSITYELSVELDKLIAQYYQVELNKYSNYNEKETKTRIQKKPIFF